MPPGTDTPDLAARASALKSPSPAQAGSLEYSHAVQIVLFTVAYFASAELGHWLSLEPGHFATFWPPCGLYLAVLLRVAPRRWPQFCAAVLLSDLASDLLLHGATAPTSLAFFCANTLEACTGALILRRWLGRTLTLSCLQDVLALAAVTLLFSAPLGAAIASLAVVRLWGGSFTATWSVWWISNVIGVLTVTPLVLTSWTRILRQLTWRMLAEAGALYFLLLATTYAVFTDVHSELGMTYWVFPLLLWAALRFGVQGVAAAMALLALLAVRHTLAGHGPIAERAESPESRVMMVQAYLSIGALSYLVLAAVMEDLHRVTDDLRDLNTGLEARVAERTADLVRSEAALAQRAAELAQADRAKDEFLAMLAHELRNPLAPIRYAIELLRLRGSADPMVERVRSLIDRQVSHLTRLVDDLLDVSRITRGKINLRREPVEIAAVVAAAVESSQPLITERQHQLQVELPQAPLRVLGDLTRLAQVVMNLLHNAAKYTEPGGHIQLRAFDQDAEIIIEVRDDGAGIPEEMLGRVFDLFAQVERTLDRSQGGLGLGLTLVQHLTQMHGGRVRALSEGLGRGCTFEVRLPLLPRDGDQEMQAGAAADTAAGAVAQAAPHRVLVVEDNPDVAEGLCMLLRTWGYEVRVAHDGHEALLLAGGEVPDVVVLDIGLPGMDGYEVARHLRARRAGPRDRPVLVALTGYGQEDDRRRGREAGIDHHLVKPVDPALLQKLLGALMVQQQRQGA